MIFVTVPFLYRDLGIRVVYSLKEQDEIMTVIVVGVRADNEVYNQAYKRRIKHGI
ncbi:MAG: hypothetical protein PVH64_01150 [Bacillota bacterium]|jgi:mRNA interferase RelE/StbE